MLYMLPLLSTFLLSCFYYSPFLLMFPLLIISNAIIHLKAAGKIEAHMIELAFDVKDLEVESTLLEGIKKWMDKFICNIINKQ